jgi:hypothetical protein
MSEEYSERGSLAYEPDPYAEEDLYHDYNYYNDMPF